LTEFEKVVVEFSALNVKNIILNSHEIFNSFMEFLENLKN